ncbi:phosphoribosyl-ATP diphosphatase [Roseomonas marmotae]|uniref:Phosphoribosyl-ATP pyrophosphatase n=1 Tax=Roseomonas marmotae TaxID=2768161 RepID=A0ABS3K6Q1_9PROT|nr:phosphoribosyl-ATP diphosphatase [Roseomonas marmotae]MBO1073132.1 phosphoribosyl-ATP diphosphatase [Roseomonas marmotae]QTI79232.1 phosphoribosyl-ATP diphosphatase [Roseomonas marmotae]
MAKDLKKKATGKLAAKPAAKKPAKKKAALPLPPDLAPVVPPVIAKARKSVRKVEARHLLPLDLPATGDIEVLRRLWETIENRRVSGDTTISHSARLLSRGTAKVAQKLGEEAVECVIEATLGNRSATVLESADLLYHLLVVWVDAGIRPEEVWAELVRREGISGIAEKAARPKGIVRAAQTTKIP